MVPEGAAVTFHLASVYGTVINALGAQPERFEGGQRHNLEIGGGGAPGASPPEVRSPRHPGA